MSPHRHHSLRDRLHRHPRKSKAPLPRTERTRLGCGHPAGDLQAQAHGFFRPIA